MNQPSQPKPALWLNGSGGNLITELPKDRRLNILNLYSGIGGNRKLWGESHNITAVEYDPKIAEIYQNLYPNDTVVVGCALEYLLDNYENFDFIWASPPCPSHSLARHWDASFIDLSLYQIIIFLKKYYKGKFCVENVIPYYQYLIEPSNEIDRHSFWTNFNISGIKYQTKKDVNMEYAKIDDWQNILGIYLDDVCCKGVNKIKILRNCVNPKVGELILNQAIKPKPTLLNWGVAE